MRWRIEMEEPGPYQGVGIWVAVATVDAETYAEALAMAETSGYASLPNRIRVVPERVAEHGEG